MTLRVGHVKPTSCYGVVPDTEDLKFHTLYQRVCLTLYETQRLLDSYGLYTFNLLRSDDDYSYDDVYQPAAVDHF